MKNTQKSFKCAQEEKLFKKIDSQRAFCCDFSLHKLIRINLI